MNWFDRNLGLVIPALVIGIIVLCCAILFKHDYVSVRLIRENKDFFGSVSNIATVLALTLGGLLSYYKFFRGRIFTTSATVDIEVDIIELPSKALVHAIYVEVKNIGTMAIWDPRLELRVDSQSESESKSFVIKNWFEASKATDGRRRQPVINIGETATYLTHHDVDSDIWIVTYWASVQSSTGDIWAKAVTVSNRIETKV